MILITMEQGVAPTADLILPLPLGNTAIPRIRRNQRFNDLMLRILVPLALQGSPDKGDVFLPLHCPLLEQFLSQYFTII
jgi:hypothetical protein